MKTRTLLLLALGCGVMIMLAGAVFLFQLTTQDDPEPPLAVGASAVVGDMTVVVDDAAEADGELVVTVTMSGAPDETPEDGFRLIASGRPAAVTATTCAATFVDNAETCTVTFDVSAADGVSRVLFYERGESQTRWLLG
ncbi:MAG TPA: hypothetical protein VMM60_02120 [Ilumatobacter sp.]|nr:hypothetical protein [Ilumatobacter sp.]